ncbi:MAG TPA: sulfotransferase [Steroidobacteraceae bacterium]|nr:sulfotransferase [Steroidobacteraceae bacterium]
MGLKVIGSGLGRTGTLSLKLALEQLGFGPCHHMAEVIQHPESVPKWIDAFEGRPDWPAIFANYHSVIDHPGCGFYRELAAYYPEAKVLHSVRDPDAWFESTQASIFAPDSVTFDPDPPFGPFFAHATRPFMGGIHDRGFMIDYFKRHNAEVIRSIPPQRLLVYEVTQGWGPLCEFLGVPVPGVPFPRANTREEFAARTAARNAARRPTQKS